MQSVAFGTRVYQLDDRGFLDPSDQWDSTFAESMAKNLGIREGLSEEHWKIINYVRGKFLQEETVPVLVTACADNNVRLHEFRALFPTGYHRGACKIAGVNYGFMYEHNYWLTYETAPPAEPRYELDPLGFLADSERWDEDFASMAAHKSKTTLTDRHWQIIHYLRSFHLENTKIPGMLEMCQTNDLSMEEFWELFPDGYRRGACLFAGLPFIA